MKGKIALLDYFDGKEAAALLIDGELHDFFAEPGANAPGSIFKVKVKHQIKENSKFIDKIREMKEEKQIIKKSVTTKKTDSKAVKKTSTTKKDDTLKSTATKTSSKKK